MYTLAFIKTSQEENIIPVPSLYISCQSETSYTDIPNNVSINYQTTYGKTYETKNGITGLKFSKTTMKTDYISVNANTIFGSSLNAFSASIWVYNTSFDLSSPIIGSAGVIQAGVGNVIEKIGYNGRDVGSQARLYLNANTFTMLDFYPQLNEWIHLVCTISSSEFDNRQEKVYVNGNLIYNEPYLDKQLYRDIIMIGDMSGLISGIRMYNYEISQTDVNALYKEYKK